MARIATSFGYVICVMFYEKSGRGTSTIPVWGKSLAQSSGPTEKPGNRYGFGLAYVGVRVQVNNNSAFTWRLFWDPGE